MHGRSRTDTWSLEPSTWYNARPAGQSNFRTSLRSTARRGGVAFVPMSRGAGDDGKAERREAAQKRQKQQGPKDGLPPGKAASDVLMSSAANVLVRPKIMVMDRSCCDMGEAAGRGSETHTTAF